MKMQTLLIPRINLLVIKFGHVDTEDFELVREEELRCCEAYAARAAGDYGDFSKAGAVDGVTTGSQGRGWIVVGERHVGVWRVGI